MCIIFVISENSRVYAAERLLSVGLKGRNWLQGLSVDFQHGLPMVADAIAQDVLTGVS